MIKKVLNVTFGISGCGKSTWLADKRPVVETDDLRREFLGDVNDISREKYIFELAKDHILELLDSSDKVYLGSTMVNSKYRSPYLKNIKKEAKKKGYDLEINLIIFKSNIKVSRERIKNDLDNKIDRANTLSILEKQYKYYTESFTKMRSEKLYKFMHHV